MAVKVISEPVMNDWYKWASMFNKFAAWATIGICALWWFLIGLRYFGIFNPFIGIYYLIAGIVAGVLYLIMCQKMVAEKDQSKKTTIWLLVCTIIGAPGIFIPLVFLFYCILSDKPFWEAFKE